MGRQNTRFFKSQGIIMQEYLQGLFVAFGLISAIGAQNAFVIKCAIQKQHTFLVCAVCVGCDVVFMSIGVLGFGSWLSQFDFLSKILALCGAVFLCYYGFLSFKSALHPKARLDSTQEKIRIPHKAILLQTLAITLLNPHMYLDTIILLGGIGVSVESQLHFLLGCISASAAWFALLGFGANALSSYFTSPKAFVWLDAMVSCVMFGIALSLVVWVLKN